MEILIILLLVFGILFIPQFFGRQWITNTRKGQIAMGVMLVCTGIVHFTNSSEMAAMLPPAIPYRLAIVYLTGVIELAFAAGLIAGKSVRRISILYITFLVLVLPANIYGALHDANVGGGHISAAYLWFRIPLQLLFITWTWYFGLRKAFGSPAQRHEVKTINKRLESLK